MKTYEWILFDADKTLYHFDDFKGLQLMFSRFGVEFTEQDYQEYQTINKSLWVEYQNGTIIAQQVQQLRFNAWADKLQIPSQNLNSAFLAAMAEICTPLEGAESLLKALKGKSKLGIITNGFIELQQVRLICIDSSFIYFTNNSLTIVKFMFYSIALKFPCSYYILFSFIAFHLCICI